MNATHPSTIEHRPPARLDSADPELRDFIQARGLGPVVDHAAGLAGANFPAGSTLTVRLFHDPEGCDRSVVLDVRTPGDVGVVLACYDHFLRDWIASSTAADRDLVRVNFTFA